MESKHNTVTVILKGHEDSPLVYKDAEIIVFDSFEDAICIKSHVKLPVNEDKTEYQDYELVETIPYSSILRYYTLDEE